VVVVSGDFDSAGMLAKLERYFGDLPPGPPVPAMALSEPAQQAERRVLLRGSDRTAYTMHSFHGVAATHPDFFPLVVMDAVLGGAKGMGLFGDSGNNRSNRLYRALVDSELAVAVGSSFRPAIDPDLFSFYVTLAPGVAHAQVEEVIWREIGKLQQGDVRPEELHKAIKQTKAQFAYSSESVTYQGYWLGFSEVVASIAWLDNWLDQLSAVSAADVQRVAQHYFAPNKQTVGWYLPD
jgi:zinc protease